MKVRKIAGFINYDKSEFESSSVLVDDDDKLESIWKTQYALTEFTDPTNYKTYDELKMRLNDVVGSDIRHTEMEMRPTAESVNLNEDSDSKSDPQEDDALSYFEKLAKE